MTRWYLPYNTRALLAYQPAGLARSKEAGRKSERLGVWGNATRNEFHDVLTCMEASKTVIVFILAHLALLL